MKLLELLLNEVELELLLLLLQMFEFELLLLLQMLEFELLLLLLLLLHEFHQLCQLFSVESVGDDWGAGGSVLGSGG